MIHTKRKYVSQTKLQGVIPFISSQLVALHNRARCLISPYCTNECDKSIYKRNVHNSNKKHISQTKHEGVMPYISSQLVALYNQAQSLIPPYCPNQYDKAIYQRKTNDWVTDATLWIDQNQEKILQADYLNTTDRHLINSSVLSISLQRALERKCITINNSKITINENSVYQFMIDNNPLLYDLAREIFVSASQVMAYFTLELISLKYNFDIILQCAIIVGLLKGTVKTLSDMWDKNAPPPSLIWNWILAIGAEVTAEVFMHRLNVRLPIGILNTSKNLFKTFFECFFGYFNQIVKGCSLFIIATTLLSETLKSGFKEITKTYFSSYFSHFLEAQICSTCISAILTAGLLNTFHAYS